MMFYHLTGTLKNYVTFTCGVIPTPYKHIRILVLTTLTMATRVSEVRRGHYVIKLHSHIQARLFAFSINFMQPWTSLWNVKKVLVERKQTFPSPTTTGVAWQLESPWLWNLPRAPTELSRSVRDSGLGDYEDHFYSNRWLQSAGWPDPVWSMQGKCSDHPAGENVGPGPTATRKWAQTKLTVSPTVHFPNDRAGTPNVDVATQTETLEDHGATWKSRKLIIGKSRKMATKNLTKVLRNLTLLNRQCKKKQMRRELSGSTVMCPSAVRKVNWQV